MNNSIKNKKYAELGKTGLNAWGGIISEEFVPELKGLRGIRIYREMLENDDIIGASLFSIEMLLRQVTWDVQSASSSVADEMARDFVETCMHDMEDTWTDFLSEVLSFLPFGWSYHEIVYKRRMGSHKKPELQSKYKDGLVGWRKLPIRSQDTLWEWKFDKVGNLLGMVQAPPPFYNQIFIPLEKALHFKTKLRKGNPEGRSILRNAYRSWHFKRRIQELEGIGIERDLAGLPLLQAPEGANIWGEEYALERATAEALLSEIKTDSSSGVLLPHGWSLDLLSSSGTKQFDTSQVIERYDNRIAMTMLADFLMLGHEQVGSFALSSDKTAMFAVALGTFLDIICQVFNAQAIPRLIELNASSFSGITGYPQLIHGDLETQNLGELGTFVKEMTSVGAITLDSALEDYLRRSANLPPKEESYGFEQEIELTSSDLSSPQSESQSES